MINKTRLDCTDVEKKINDTTNYIHIAIKQMRLFISMYDKKKRCFSPNHNCMAKI